jgi:hypothetical protein
MYLTRQERQALRDASAGINGPLDHIVAGIRQTNPQAFHTKETLSERVFYHEPKNNEPYKAYMRPASSKLLDRRRG